MASRSRGRSKFSALTPTSGHEPPVSDRKRAIAVAEIVPSVLLVRQLELLPEPKPAGVRSRRRLIDYGDGMTAIITDGEARRIEFADGE